MFCAVLGFCVFPVRCQQWIDEWHRLSDIHPPTDSRAMLGRYILVAEPPTLMSPVITNG